MIEVIRFEMKGFFKRKKNVLSIIFFILILLCFIILQMNTEQKIVSSKAFSETLKIQSLEENLLGIEADISKYKNDTAVLNKLNKIKDDTKLEISLREGLVNAIESRDWHEELNMRIKLDELSQKQINPGNPDSSITVEKLKKSINKNKFLLNNNIRPIEEDYTVNGYNCIRNIMKYILPLLLPIFLFIICSDMVSKEFDEGTYKILFTQPVSRRKILLSKFITYSILAITVTFFVLFAFFIIIGLIRGFGYPGYPIEFYSRNKPFFAELINIEGNTFIGLKDFVLIASLLYIPFLILLTAFAMFISMIFANSSGAISISILIYVVTYILNSKMSLFKSFVHLLPFTYSNIPQLLDGTTMYTVSNISLTAKFSVFIFIAYTIVFYVISSLIISKRDMVS